MSWSDAATAALRSLGRRAGRAVLTVLAVALAAALLSALLIISTSARTRVLSQLSKGGPLSGIQVAAAAPSPAALDTDNPKPGRRRDIDADALARIRSLGHVRSVVPLESNPVLALPVRGTSQAFRDSIAGFDLARAATLPISVVTGRLPTPRS